MKDYAPIRTPMPWLNKRIDRLSATNSLPREDLDELIEVIVILETKLRALSMAREKCLPCEARAVLKWLRERGREGT